MSERDKDEGDLEWAGMMEECKRELSCVCQKMAQAAGWQPRRPCRPHAPKIGEQKVEGDENRQGGARHLFTSSDEDSEEDAPEGRRARPSDPWLAPVHASVECDLVWGGYLDSTSRGQPMCKEGIDKIKCEVNDFHSERMNSPPPPKKKRPLSNIGPKHLSDTLSWHKPPRNTFASPQVALHQSSSFSKSGHIVRARRATLSNEHVKELSFLFWNQDLMY